MKYSYLQCVNISYAFYKQLHVAVQHKVCTVCICFFDWCCIRGNDSIISGKVMLLSIFFKLIKLHTVHTVHAFFSVVYPHVTSLLCLLTGGVTLHVCYSRNHMYVWYCFGCFTFTKPYLYQHTVLSYADLLLIFFVITCTTLYTYNGKVYT
jgi:hypothetical protein